MWKDHIYLKTNTSDELELYSSLDTPSSEESSDSEDSSFFLEFFLDFLDEWLLDSESTSILLFFLLCFGGDFDGEGSGVAFWKVKKYGEEYLLLGRLGTGWLAILLMNFQGILSINSVNKLAKDLHK